MIDLLPPAPAPVLSIIVPNYRTEEFTRLCLRSLRKYSQLPNEVIVVDNNSADASTEYLRGLKWIRLIENTSQAIGTLAHLEALDLAARVASGRWFVLFHSDTIVLEEGWDRKLVAMAEAAGAMGFSTTVRKLDCFEPWWRRPMTLIKDWFRSPKIGPGDRVKFMSHCFAIRRDIVPWTEFSFCEAGDAISLYDFFIRGRHRFLELGRSTLEPLMWHPSDVTSVMTNQMTERKQVSRFQARTKRLKRAAEIQAILADASLDR